MIGAVVLHYRNFSSVVQTIHDLQQQTVPVDIVLVDNASGDGMGDRLRDVFPDVKIVEAPKNRGYAAGMNLGRRQHHTDALLFVTHDVRMEPTAVEEMAKHLGDGVGMVGPLLHREDDGRVFSSGGHIGPEHRPVHLTDVPPSVREVEWIDGACMLVSAHAFDAVGAIDEGYFLYYEEVDFACRLRRENWRVLCAPAAIAKQMPSQLPRALYYRNWLRFVELNVGRAAAKEAMVRTAKLAMADMMPRNPKRAMARLAALVAFVLRLPARRLL